MSKQKMMTISMLAAMVVLASMTMHAKAQAREGQDAQEGMVMVRDAQTGKMRAPTPEELRALRAKAPPPSATLRAAQAAPQAVSRRGGGHGVRLSDKSRVFEVVTRGEDGKLSSQCVHGEAAAGQALQHPAAAAEEHRHEAR